MSYRLTPRVQLRSSPATFSKAFSVYRGEPPRLVVAMAAEDITRLTILSFSIDKDKGEKVVDMDKLRMVRLVIYSAAIATTNRGGSSRYTLNDLENVAGDYLSWT